MAEKSMCRTWSRLIHTCLLALGLVAGSTGETADWPQWRGPQRDGIWRETGTVEQIPATGLPVRWRIPVEGGYAGPAVVGGRVFVTDYVRRDGELANNPNDRTLLAGNERVLCLDATTGQVLWKYDYDCPYSISYAAGPRCTPTVHDGRVYVVGAEGNLLCLEASTGKLLWQKDFKRDYAAPTPIWGFCGHPLVVDDLLICLVGGEGSVAVAFDRVTGEERWRALSASEQGYCPPTLMESAGRRQLLIWDADNLNSLEPTTGELLWSEPLKPAYGMSIMAPQLGQLNGQQVLFASGIGNVATLLKLDQQKPAAEVIWKGKATTAVYCANNTPHIVDGVIYGVGCRNGQLRGVDMLTGKRLWESFAPTTGTRRAGHATAFLVRHDDRWFLFSETGDLILAKLSRQGYEEIDRFHVLEPTGEAFGRRVVWSHPAFANRCVFVRNDKEIVCVSLAAKQQ